MPDGRRSVQKLERLGNPNWIVAEVNYGDSTHFQLIDLATGTAKHFTNEAPYGAWDSVPGRNAVVSIPRDQDPKQAKLVVTTVDAGGVTALRQLDLPPGLVSPDINDVQGDWITVRDFTNRRMFLYGRDGKPRELPVHQPQADQFMAHTLVHPNGKELAVLSIDKATNRFKVYWYTMEKMQKIGEFNVPVGVFALSADGEAIVTKNDDVVRVDPIAQFLSSQDRP